MTKTELAHEISVKTGIDKKTTLNIVEAFMETLKENMGKGEEVYLRGFGSFIIKHRAEKPARNITTNTTVIIPAHDIPAFKPVKEFVEGMKK